ncbi:hypothetical protein [Burkholderia ambifaria]|uniref:hypothetical protein n=1 Tax=Burkholderia ambifaria TaxID=152480 RepID=UPI00158DF3BA|nr:hypothetical protein [Burkholderia ambifaria]
MSKKSKPVPTVDELISTIKHSSLPTVVLEGDDDVIALRCMEEEYYDIGLSVLPAGGRNNVLKIFDRRSEFATQAVAFVADKDTWVMSSIPDQYVDDDLIFTSGYSIENDVYVDGDVERLMSLPERQRFKAELEVFARWYALAVNRCLNNTGEEYKLHPNAILDDAVEREKRMALEADEVYPEELRESLLGNYRQIIRGKSLMALLIRHLSYRGRVVHHNHLQIIEQVGCQRGPLIDRIFGGVATIINRKINEGIA